MTAIVENVQKQGVESGIITLYQLEYATGTFAYFTSGTDEDLTDIQFRDPDGTVRTYTPIPIEIDGFDVQSDGALSRPKMRVANIESTFKNSIGGLTFEDLVGKRITRRTTQEKYLVGNSGDATPPVEFPKITYVIDRIASKNVMQVEFELAAPFDLAGIRLPRRVIIGGACPWKYQGASTTLSEADKEGGCHWRLDNKLVINGTERLIFINVHDEHILPFVSGVSLATAASGTSNFTKDQYYFTTTTQQRYDTAGVLSSVSNTGTYQYWQCLAATTSQPSATNASFRKVRRYHSSYSSSTTYRGYLDKAFNENVLYNNVLWQVKRISVAGVAPEEGEFWTRADNCGKKLNSCSIRYQAKLNTVANSQFVGISANRDNRKSLPFGGYPGVVQRRR